MPVARVRQGSAWVESALAGKVRSGGTWHSFGPDGEDGPELVSLFTSQTPATPTWSDPSTSLTLGTVVTVTEAGTVVGGRWRFPGTVPGGMTATYVLYDNISRAVLRRQAFVSPTAGAWNQVTFTVPYPVEAGASLVAAVHLAGTSLAYPFTSGFFSAAGVTSGGLFAPPSSGDPLSIGNGRFITNDGYPSSTYNSTNYFVDLVYEGAAVGAGGDVALTGPNRPVLAGEPVTMSVTATNLGGGETITGYAWVVRSGGGSLSSSSGATPAYTAPSGAGVAVVRATATTSLGRTGWVDVRVGFASTIVAAENLLPGTLRATWDLPSGSFGGVSTLQGFADGFSVNRDETVPFKIGQSDSAGWTAQVYRLGWYGGTGARLIATLAPDSTQLAASQAQPSPVDVDPVTTLLSADCAAWSTTLTWTPPAWAPSGMYVLRLNRVGGGASHVMFVLRDDDRAADLMLMPSDSTWQAYNAWGGLGTSGQYAGNSLYYGTAVNQYNSDSARYVSYNRPIVNRGACDPSRDYGAVKWSNFFSGEYPMVRFLERNGYDVKYYSCLDAAGDPTGDLLANVSAAMMVGHNEYWSDAMRSGWEAAKAAGTSVFSCAGNEVFWRLVGSAPDSAGRPRTWECYKSTIDSRGSTGRTEWTGTWRDPAGAGKGGDQPENTLTGTIFITNGPDLRSLVVPADGGYSATPLWRHTTVAALTTGQTWSSPNQILGFEWDTYGPAGTSGTGSAYMAAPHADTVYCSDVTYSIASGVLLTGPGDEYDAAGTATHRLVVHPGGGGALTFGTGTINWALGVDNANTYQLAGSDNTSTVIQQATVNVLRDMGATAATLMSGLTAPTPVDWWDETPPPDGEAWTLTTPAGGTDTSDSAVSLGVPFAVTEAGEWTGMRVWVTPTAPSISPSAVAYNVDAGTRLAVKTYTEPAGRSAYHDVLFDAPVPVVPGVTYQAAIHTTRFGFTHRDSLTLPMRSLSERVYSGSDAGTLCLFRYESAPGTTPLTSFTTSYAHMAPLIAFD